MFLGGFIVPIRYFPDWLQPLALALPFASITQTPADLFVERLDAFATVSAVALQAFWAVALLLAAQLATVLATRRVVIKGG